MLSIAAEASGKGEIANSELGRGGKMCDAAEDLATHSFPSRENAPSSDPQAACGEETKLRQALEEAVAEARRAVYEERRRRRIYRGRTINMLRRYMRYSMETGRLPSLLGREFFRAKVTSYIVVTFEDRVIFVHDMETCLNKLDEFSRQIIARHILQEHDQAATGRLLNCTERTVRTYVPMALDLLSDILLEVGLLEPLDSNREKSCQGGKKEQIFVTHCKTSKNKF